MDVKRQSHCAASTWVYLNWNIIGVVMLVMAMRLAYM
jgi:hypothetical protein